MLSRWKLASLGTLALSLSLGRASGDKAKLNKFNTGVDSKARSRPSGRVQAQGELKVGKFELNSRSNARDPVERVQVRIGNSRAMSKAMENQSNCKEGIHE